jgi:hypothetical protein
MNRTYAVVLLLTMFAAACAPRLGRAAPELFRTLAIATTAESPDAAAGRIQAVQADVAILAVAADSAWFAEVARATGLQLSGPGVANGVSFAFLGPEAVGDTTVRIPVNGGGELPVHDALYRIDDRRVLDVLAVAVPPGIDLLAAVRAINGYVATDVDPRAAIALAVLPPTAAAGDTLATLLQPLFLDAAACVRTATGAEAPGPPALRLFYGPAVRIRCEGGRFLEGGAVPLFARLIVLP